MFDKQRIIMNEVCAEYKITGEEKEKFMKAKMPLFVSFLPFIARTDFPENDARHNLEIYVGERKFYRDRYKHEPIHDQNPFERIKPMCQFSGGDKRIIDKGLSLMCITMLADYKKDQKEDEQKGKYNPLNSGAWMYEEILLKLKSYLYLPCPVLDSIYSFDVAVEGLWGWG